MNPRRGSSGVVPLGATTTRPGSDDTPERVTSATVPTLTDMAPHQWAGALRAYSIAQRAAGLSPRTIRLHTYRIHALSKRHARPALVCTTDLLAELARDDWAPETRKSVRGSFRSFFRWALDAGVIGDDPSARLPPVRVPPAVPRPAPESVVDVGRSAEGRSAFMVELAAYAGLRAGEIAKVHGDDLDGDVLRVCGKGGRVRLIPIEHAGLLERLRSVDGWAFPNGRGTHLSSGHVTKLVSRALPGHWTAHPLRHRFGTVAHDGTGDLLAVRDLLGHSSVDTTIRYVQLNRKRLRAAAAAASVA